MASNGDKTAMARSRRNRMWLLAVCAGLVVGQPTVATSQTTGGPVGTQLDASLREPVCQLLRSLQGTFGDVPGVAAIFTSLLQSFGCASGPTPGTTTTTAVFPTTTTTMAPGTTTTTMDGTNTTSAPTSSTTLPPCIPNNPVTTTVPCVPTTPTTVPTGGTTTTTGPTGGTTTTTPSGVTTTTHMH